MSSSPGKYNIIGEQAWARQKHLVRFIVHYDTVLLKENDWCSSNGLVGCRMRSSLLSHMEPWSCNL